MDKSSVIKLTVAAAALTVAIVLFVQFLRGDGGVTEKTFFYDLSEKKLFAGPRNAVPPIRGLNDATEDAVRAVVISTNANPADKKSWKIAYLEKYTPELKRQIEEAKRAGTSPEMGRGAAQAHRLVRRLEQTEWFPMTTPEGEQIATEWATPGSNGITPVVCVP
jgi:hypothetical protein